MEKTIFEWDQNKNESNILKHGVSFYQAEKAFLDPHRVIYSDLDNSITEDRFFCFGKVEGEIMTVRFTYRNSIIRIYGAGFWRKGRKIYEKEQN
ncbi:MAG: BrnT family toxin [Candidatus Protochlamydia sp.]|nr:BrnT family toxin [Candidatus Protochlamydia sp.]